MGSQFRIISWNGLKISIPRSCQEIISAPCHLVIESNYLPFLEIRWERQSPRGKGPTAESVYREISRQKNSSCCKADLPPPLAQLVHEKKGIGVSWEGESGDLGIIWQCGQCSTLVFCHLHTHPDFSFEQIAETLMSVECHCDETDFTEWSLQDFHLVMPAGFLFTSSYFGAGLTRLTFQDKDTTLHVCRLAPASEKLAGKTVKDILFTLHDRFSSAESSCRENDNDIECWTTPSLVSQVLHRLRRKKAFCRGHIRHDDINNRLLTVIAESNRPIGPEPSQTIFQHYEIVQQEE